MNCAFCTPSCALIFQQNPLWNVNQARESLIKWPHNAHTQMSYVLVWGERLWGWSAVDTFLETTFWRRETHNRFGSDGGVRGATLSTLSLGNRRRAHSSAHILCHAQPHIHAHMHVPLSKLFNPEAEEASGGTKPSSQWTLEEGWN